MWRVSDGSITTDFFFQAEDGIRDRLVAGVQTCALPILNNNKKIIPPRILRGTVNIMTKGCIKLLNIAHITR